MQGSDFEYTTLYSLAITSKNFEAFKKNLHIVNTSHIDMREPKNEFATVAFRLAMEGKHAAVERLRKAGANVNEIARAYAIQGKHKKVEEYRKKHFASVSEIAMAYAFAKNHKKVDEYQKKHSADLDYIARGYLEAGEYLKVKELMSKFPNQISISKILAHHRFLNPDPDLVKHFGEVELSRIEARCYAAQENNGALESIIQTCPTKTKEFIYKDLLINYAFEGNHAKVKEFEEFQATKINPKAYSILGYAKAGSHEKVNEYLATKDSQLIMQAIRGYILAGYYTKVTELIDIFSIDPADITRFFV